MAGLIVTTPEEALRSERVDPSSQSEQAFPALIERAMRDDWDVPSHKKPVLVDELIAVAEVPLDESNPKMMLVKVQAVNALHRGDQMAYERKNPEAAGKAKGGVKVDVANQVNVLNVDPYEMWKKAELEVQEDEVERQIEAARSGGDKVVRDDEAQEQQAVQGGNDG